MEELMTLEIKYRVCERAIKRLLKDVPLISGSDSKEQSAIMECFRKAKGEIQAQMEKIVLANEK